MINVIGDIFGSSGYASHTRQLANALSNLTEVRLSTNLVPGWNMEVTDKELDMIKKQPKSDEINLIITHPLYWKINLGKRNWAYLVWEGDKIPECFIEECFNKDIEYILVPSQHTKDAILNTWREISYPIGPNQPTYLEEKIKIIPHGVDLNLFYPKEKPIKCVFVANKGLRGPEDRGGIQYLLKAYLEEFTDEDVELIVKINPAYGLIDINQLIDQMGVKMKKFPKITINNQMMKYSDLVKLYNMGTVFVSPTRSDAFNIPCLEAMACGLPVITTNFGGQTDFVNEGNGWLIGGELTEVKWDLMYESISWLTPSIKELKERLRYCYEHPEEIIIKGKKALEISKEWTWDLSAKKIISLL
jgi:glycosyltransferase involved in cell wall biosynthesis